MNGGARIARVLYDRGIREIFTLCGGHISPILVEAKRIGIRITDVRDEATAVFAADAYARLTGIPGRRRGDRRARDSPTRSRR
jgi:thiamine pyrophosphate-dependent acetolactate synthase large subunit-like protein